MRRRLKTGHNRASLLRYVFLFFTNDWKRFKYSDTTEIAIRLKVETLVQLLYEIGNVIKLALEGVSFVFLQIV